MARRKVLLIGLNEITRTFIAPMNEAGNLPAIARLERDAAWASPLTTAAAER